MNSGVINLVTDVSGSEFEFGGVVLSRELRNFTPARGRLTAISEG